MTSCYNDDYDLIIDMAILMLMMSGVPVYLLTCTTRVLEYVCHVPIAIPVLEYSSR